MVTLFTSDVLDSSRRESSGWECPPASAGFGDCICLADSVFACRCTRGGGGGISDCVGALRQRPVPSMTASWRASPIPQKQSTGSQAQAVVGRYVAVLPRYGAQILRARGFPFDEATPGMEEPEERPGRAWGVGWTILDPAALEEALAGGALSSRCGAGCWTFCGVGCCILCGTGCCTFGRVGAAGPGAARAAIMSASTSKSSSMSPGAARVAWEPEVAEAEVVASFRYLCGERRAALVAARSREMATACTGPLLPGGERSATYNPTAGE